MPEPEWKKGAANTKWPQKAFNSILVASYPGLTKNKKPCLKLNFEDKGLEQEVELWGLKAEEGQVLYSMGVESFVDSLEVLGFSCEWAVDPDGTTILGFRTDPDTLTCRLWMEPIEDKKVGDESQTETRIKWGKVLKVEREKPTNITAPAAKKEAEPQAQADLNEIVKAKLTEPTTLSELYTKLDKAYKPPVLRDVLVALKSEGWIEQLPGDKYKVIA